MLEQSFCNKIEAGCDEAGRGCLAGPVVAAAVILPKDFKNKILNDSKLLSRKKRVEIEKNIKRNAISWAVSSISNSKIDEINKHLRHCDGVMIGRSIYQNPYSLVEIEKEIFNTEINPTREQVAEQLLDYVGKEVKLGTKVNHIMRHTVGLYHGQIGSKDWKRYLSDNLMARESDFQKTKHIMTIVQNNEKANQVNK